MKSLINNLIILLFSLTLISCHEKDYDVMDALFNIKKEPVSSSKIKNENDTCANNHYINYVSVKTSKLDRFINLSPMIVFGIILLYQLFKIYCKKKDI